MQRLLVVSSVSTRRLPQEDCEEWLDFRPGKTYPRSAFPKHAPVDEWISSGHLKPVREGGSSE